MKITFLALILIFCAFGGGLPAEETKTAENSVELAISGQVFDADGKPVSGALVKGDDLPIAVSDENGKFRIEVTGKNLIVNLQLLAWLPETDMVGFKNLPRFPGGIDKFPEMNIVLKKGHRFHGRVLDNEETPVSGAIIGGLGNSFGSLEPVETDENGRFEFFHISDNLDDIFAYKPGVGLDCVNFKPLGTPATADSPGNFGPFEFKLTKTAPVTVHVESEEGTPLEGIGVGLHYYGKNQTDAFQCGDLGDSQYAREKKILHATTDAEGNTVIDWIPENVLAAIYASPPRDPKQDKNNRYGYAPRIILQPEQTEITVKLPRWAYIECSVKLPDGSPVPFAYLKYYVDSGVGWIYADEKGEFIKRVPPHSKLSILAQSSKGTTAPVYFDAGEGNNPERIDIVLEKGTKFHGRVTEGNNPAVPLQNKSFSVFKINESANLKPGFSSVSRTVRCNEDGYFETILLPGEYGVSFNNAFQGATRSRLGAKPIQFTITEDEPEKRLDFNLKITVETYIEATVHEEAKAD